MRNKIGAGATQQRRAWERPTYSFRLQATHESKIQAEAIYGFYCYHQGDIPFWFSGQQWGSTAGRVFVGWGDGVRTQFFLPVRNVTGHQAYVSEVLTGSGVVGSSGLLTFASPPAADAPITASYTCRYKCVFWNDGDVLLTEQEFVANLFTYEGITLREVVP